MMRRRDCIKACSSLVLVGALAGCSDGGSTNGGGSSSDAQSSGEGDQLSLGSVEYADGEPRGYQQFEPRSSTTYQIGETVWFYTEPSGVTVEETDDGAYTFDILMELWVTLPDGSTRKIGSRTYSQPIDNPTAVESLYLKPSVSITDTANPGTYEAKLTVTDQLDGESVTRNMTFEVQE